MQRDKMFSNINPARFMWALFCMLAIVILFISLNRWFDCDEFEAIHSSWKILRGEKIYIDFFQNHHPFFYYQMLPVIAIFKESIATIIALRIMVFLMLLLIFIVTYLISIRVFGKETGIISVVLLATTLIFITPAIEIRPDVPQTLFGLLSVLLLIDYFENKSVKYLALSSFFLGLSFLFLQKAVFLILLTGGILLVDAYRKNINGRNLLLYLVVFVITIAPYFTYLLHTNSFSSYIMFGWIINMKYLNQFSPFGYLKIAFRENTMLWCFWLLGFLFFTDTPDQKRLRVLSLGLFIFIFFVRSPYKQYLMMAMPLVAILSANAINSIFRKNTKMFLVVLIISIILPCYVLLCRKEKPSNRKQLEKINYVLSVTDKEDYVYDGDTLFNVFRKDIDFFWLSVSPKYHLETYKTITQYDYDIYELIDKYKPKVISNYHIGNMWDKRISKHYVQSDKYEDLFIRTNAD
ncbi:MAG: ArnT family glycosyltransferase [Candidatus Scalindua sp.]